MLKIARESASNDEIHGISVKYALSGVLRSVPYMLMHRRCYLPDAMLKDRDLSVQKLFDFNHKEEIIEVVQIVHNLIVPFEKPQSQLLKVQQRMSDIYLNQIKQSGFDVFSASVQREPLFFALRLALSSLF